MLFNAVCYGKSIGHDTLGSKTYYLLFGWYVDLIDRDVGVVGGAAHSRENGPQAGESKNRLKRSVDPPKRVRTIYTEKNLRNSSQESYPEYFQCLDNVNPRYSYLAITKKGTLGINSK